MQAVETFNSMMVCFLEDLGHAFPGMACIAAAEARMQVALVASPRAPMDVFAASIAPHMHKIQAHDETFLSEDLARQAWFPGSAADAATIAGAPAEDKHQIFEWLSQLAFLAVGVANLPEESMQMVDDLVEALSADGGSTQALLSALGGDGGTPDINALVSVLGGSGAFVPA